MSFEYKTATVFGGTGFIGTQVVREFARLGIVVKVASRIPEKAYFLRPCGTVGQIVPVACDYQDKKNIAAVIQGSDYVVNCIGILHQKKSGQFQKVHAELPGVLARLCQEKAVERFVHISALGVERSKAKYAKSKLEGEKAVFNAFPQATILRPSVVFGEDDSFFNKFASMAQVLPALPLIGGGHTKFQPVFVGDVADAALKALTLPAVGDKNPQGQIYELGGPDIVTFKEIYEKLFDYTNRRRSLISLPFWAAKTQACFMRLLPNPPLTPDQVELLKTDNVVSENAKTLTDLDIHPVSMDLVLPDYLEQYRPGGRFPT